MTVSELITRLQNMPQDREVVFNIGESVDYVSVEELTPKKIWKDDKGEMHDHCMDGVALHYSDGTVRVIKAEQIEVVELE